MEKHAFSLVPLMSKLLIIEVCEVVFSEKLVVANVWHPRAFAWTNWSTQQPQQQRATRCYADSPNGSY